MSVKVPKKLEEFSIAAYTLCNDWRDTIFYSTLAGGYAICKIAGVDSVEGMPVSLISIIPAMLREHGRSL